MPVQQLGKVWELSRQQWGQSTSLQPEEQARCTPRQPHPSQLFPIQNTARDCGNPRRNEGLLAPFPFCPEHGSSRLQGGLSFSSLLDVTRIVQGTGTKPHKGNTAPAETRSHFYGSSAHRTKNLKQCKCPSTAARCATAQGETKGVRAEPCQPLREQCSHHCLELAHLPAREPSNTAHGEQQPQLNWGCSAPTQDRVQLCAKEVKLPRVGSAKVIAWQS